MRLPTPTNTGGEVPDLTQYKASPGYAHIIMYDLQRVFACLEMQKDEKDQNLAYLVAVAQEAAPKFRSQVTLAMSANSDWRTVSNMIQQHVLGHAACW